MTKFDLIQARAIVFNVLRRDTTITFNPFTEQVLSTRTSSYCDTGAKKVRVCAAIFVMFLASPLLTLAQEKSVKLPGIAVPAISGKNIYSEELHLPDKSTIRSVWPTALCVSSTPGQPWKDLPCTNSCEPLIYSLARFLEDGRQIWAKSYVYLDRESVVVCHEDHWGFDLETRLYGLGGPLDRGLFHVLPYDEAFYIGNPLESGEAVRLSSLTGEIVGKAPLNMRAIDAAWLAQLKRSVWQSVMEKYPDPSSDELISRTKEVNRVESTRKEELRRKELFNRVENAIYPASNNLFRIK